MFGKHLSYAAWAATILVAALATSTIAQTHSQQIMSLEPARLVEIVKDPEATVFDKAKACQRLAVVGTKDAVPALAALLSDETLNVYARFGLEGIADPLVDEALRDAATKLVGRQLIGVLGSIGKRQDAQAVELLRGKEFLGSSDPAVVTAAAGALGRIATPQAADVLRQALAQDAHSSSQAAAPTIKAIGDACLICADRLAASGHKRESLTLYEAIGKADLPKQFQIAALAGQFRLRKNEAKDLLLAQLRSPDEAFFALGLAVAREMPGADVTAALVKQFDQLSAERQALLLRALGDRGDPTVLTSVRTASQSEYPAVREAAIRVLAKLDDPSAVDILLNAALGDDDTAPVALEALRALAVPAADKAIAARLTGASLQDKVVLFDLVAARGIADAQPEIRKALTDSDQEVRLAAIAALGQTAELKDFDLLVTRAFGQPAVKETDAAKAALRTAALRMGDRDACATTLAANLRRASASHQGYLLDLLGEVSGKKALEIVVANAKSNDPSLKEEATRVLGEWVNADVAPALLDIARNDPETKYQIRALRGYIRVARQLQLPDEERLSMFHTTMQVARRDDEKRLALDILTRIPSAETLQLSVSHLDQAPLKNAAADAAVKIAGKLVDQPRPVADAMQKVVASGVSGDIGSRARQLLGQARAGSR